MPIGLAMAFAFSLAQSFAEFQQVYSCLMIIRKTSLFLPPTGERTFARVRHMIIMIWTVFETTLCKDLRWTPACTGSSCGSLVTLRRPGQEVWRARGDCREYIWSGRKERTARKLMHSHIRSLVNVMRCEHVSFLPKQLTFFHIIFMLLFFSLVVLY